MIGELDKFAAEAKKWVKARMQDLLKYLEPEVEKLVQSIPENTAPANPDEGLSLSPLKVSIQAVLMGIMTVCVERSPDLELIAICTQPKP